MFPAGKKFFITLYKANESFFMISQDPAAHQNVIFQMTNCTIEVPMVELTDDLKKEERQKIASDEGICYSLMNQYYRTFYIYPNDTVLYNNNITQGYKPKYLFLYWVDYTCQSSGDININNFVLERPNLRLLEVWCADIQLKKYKPCKNQTDWDAIYQDFIEWTGCTYHNN